MSDNWKIEYTNEQIQNTIEEMRDARTDGFGVSSYDVGYLDALRLALRLLEAKTPEDMEVKQ